VEAEMTYSRSHKIDVNDFDGMNSRFEDTHAAQARKFELLWLWMNQETIRAARIFGLDVSDRSVKCMLTEISSAALELSLKQLPYLQSLKERYENGDKQS
jgi:hypothetical protein